MEEKYEYESDGPEPISLRELGGLNLSELEEDKCLLIMEDNFPEAKIRRDGAVLLAEITEHIYTKYWVHKYHAMVFAEAVVRAVRRLAIEEHPLSDATLENDDEPHIFIRWRLTLPITVRHSTEWAEAFFKEFSDFQKQALPWLK